MNVIDVEMHGQEHHETSSKSKDLTFIDKGVAA